MSAPRPSAATTTSHAALATDAGARFLGELGIGTNAGIDRATGSILLDEKMAGTVHLALGRSYPETGGTNDSALHWDLICDLRDGGRLTADGEPIVPHVGVNAQPPVTIAPRQYLGQLHAPNQDRRHDRTRLPGPGDARAHGRGRDGRRAAELLPRQPRDARRERRAACAAASARPAARWRSSRTCPGRRSASARSRTTSPSSSPARSSCCCAAPTDASATASGCRCRWGGLAQRGRPRGRHLPRRRRDPPARHRRCARATARSRPRSRSAARSPRARASTSRARRAGCPPCPRRTSTCCASASRSASTWSRCRSCAPPRTSTSVRRHTRLPLIAKIEKPQAVDSAEEIIRAADCVMVARGDLGIELPIEDVPIVQKQLLRIAGRLARPSITATQMLDSMVNSSRPDPRRGRRRGQRDPRRHRRGDALPGDRGRRLPGRGGRDDGLDRRAHRAHRCPTGPGTRSGSAATPATRPTRSPTARAPPRATCTWPRWSCRRCRAARPG